MIYIVSIHPVPSGTVNTTYARKKGLVSKSATYNHTPWKDGAHLRYYPIKILSQSGTVKTNIGGVRIRDTLSGNQLLTSQTDLINAKKD